MKIKRKVQKTLPQLIEWLLKSGHCNYTGRSNMGNSVVLSPGGKMSFSLGTFYPQDNFTVEVEEEITEDTVFETLIEIYKNRENLMFSTVHRNVSINNVKTNDYLITSGFYILNDDLTMTLIWRDGKLVE